MTNSNNQAVNIFSKILASLFALYGLLLSLTSCVVIVGTGVGKYGDELLKSIGDDSLMKDYPWALALGLIAFSAILAILYFACSYSLFKTKKWAPIAVGLLGLTGLALGAFELISGLTGAGIKDVIFGVIYSSFAFLFYTKKDLFKN